MLEDYVIKYRNDQSLIAIVNENISLPLVVLSDHPQIKRAAQVFQNDIEEITNVKPKLLETMTQKSAIIVTSLNDINSIEELELDIDDIKDRWEHFAIITKEHPVTMENQIYVIGSDVRGTVFGIYDLIEKIGKNPWYWWLDIPTSKHQYLGIEKDIYFIDGPKVKYRGIFLNDEGPSLMTWARKHYPDFNHEFYERIFDLIIRLKGNYLWPAMWDSSFYEDDTMNILKANEFGIVIGTSHHEPMNRPHKDWKKHGKGPWNYITNKEEITEFWREGIQRTRDYETIINLGMRGDGDEPMHPSFTNQEKSKLTEIIISDQREIITQENKSKDIAEIPQAWALYKEVKEYFDNGMNIPEDIILIWGDDNWGNIRRLPKEEELDRSGGAGIYYHFDYVGGPRSYKWIASTSIQKIWEQMDKAYQYQANKLWVVNVGDLKPIEYQTDFFLRMAWNPEKFNANNLSEYTFNWLKEIFVDTDLTKCIQKMITFYLKLNGRVKPELLNATTIYSWDAYLEAEKIIQEINQMIKLADEILGKIPLSLKDTFYQLAYYPLVATGKVTKMQLYMNLNKKLMDNNSILTNTVAHEISRLFYKDNLLTFMYNSVVSKGKWKHMMDQIHIGYEYWNQPDTLEHPDLYILEKQNYLQKFSAEFYQEKINSYENKNLLLRIFNQGNTGQNIRITSNDGWLIIEEKEFNLNIVKEIKLGIKWDSLPENQEIIGSVNISNGKQTVNLNYAIDNFNINEGDYYIPLNNVISIDAQNYSSKKDIDTFGWELIPNYGKTTSSMGLYPVQKVSKLDINNVATISYRFNIMENAAPKISIITAPSLPFWDETTLSLAIEIDRETKIATTGDLSQNGIEDSESWTEAVINNCHIFKFDWENLNAGIYELIIKPISPQLIIQKIMIDFGGMQPSFLGSPTTPKANELNELNREEFVYNEFFDDHLFLNIENDIKNFSGKVYSPYAGWYIRTDEGQDSLEINGDDLLTETNKDNYFFIPHGFSEINPKQNNSNYTLSFVGYKPLSIEVYLHDISNELEKNKVDLSFVLFNDSDRSHLFELEIQCLSNTKELINQFSWSTRILSKEFNKHNQIINLMSEDEVDHLRVNIMSEGFHYTEYHKIKRG